MYKYKFKDESINWIKNIHIVVFRSEMSLSRYIALTEK